MRRERNLNSFHEQRVGRLASAIEQIPKRRADVEGHPVGQTVSVGNLDLGRIDVEIRKSALVQERRREVEMKTLHPVRVLKMTFLRPDWNEVAHAKPRQALLDFTVAGATQHHAA
ncbi:MAG: hypothetical protein E6614_28310 [Bradyrhizobium sp.]|jgi:hypothetical protein|nr:hypothetical protein [Bradyrhizobium sp.]MDU6375058.1 hypothetical protein [Bradyrhizobium sp.]MDU6726275.1 hypothetical protein [Bradyrhizobium sp.]MDU6749751.1 hypothetical protein [Bradyrhizobium sp.]